MRSALSIPTLHRRSLGLAGAAVSAAAFAAPASAIIVDTLGDARPLLTPPSAVIGAWGSNASAVAIGPNHIITTRHQDGPGENPALRQVVFDGVTYDSVSQTLFDPGAGDNWDIRVIEIAQPGGAPANLTDFVPLYTRSTGESLVGQRVVLAGPGVIGVNESPAGFDWAAGAGTPSNPANNFGINFGENRIDASGTQNAVVDGFNGGPGFTLDFDSPSTPGALVYEAAVGPGDSGGALLHFRYDQWWLVGLPNSVDPATGTQPDAFYGQNLFAFDVTDASFVSQVETAIGGGFSFPVPAPLPEPASAVALLGLGGLMLRRR
ncbi:MAG: hypothetical protein AAGF84_04920 [Planctomycetota bacterium]